MATAPQFDPNASYSIPAFDPNASYQSVNSPPADLTANPKGEGTYAMVGPNGKTQIPFGNVGTAKEQGFQFANADDLNRYGKDAGHSLYQRGKDNFNFNTRGAQPGDGAVKGFVENVGQGGAQTVRALAHPINTVDSMATALRHPLDSAHAEVDQLYADPSRFIGNAIGQAGTGAIIGEVAAPVADVAAQAAGKVAGRAILLGKTPTEAYESALKPSTTLSQAERDAIVKTGLENAIPVSKGGVEAIWNRIGKLNQEIKDEIANDPTRPIDPNKVATRADIAKAKFAKQVNAQPDLNAIEASRQQFLAEQGAKPGTAAIPPKPTGVLDQYGNPYMDAGTPAQPPKSAPPMNAADAQAMKQGTYSVLKGKYGEQGSASVEAQKALARGLKEEIAIQFPEISKLNANESRLLDLQPVLERAVNRISNHQLIGIGTPVAGAAADAVAGPAVGRVAMVLKAVLDNPNVKSRLAISLSKGAKIPYARAAARVAAYTSALESSSQVPQGYSYGDSPSQPTIPQP